VSYSLTNAGKQSIKLDEIFVGARNPANVNKDAQVNLGRVVAPGKTVNAQGQVFISSSGEWQLWPCYYLGDIHCPDKWRVISFLAEK
jgi:hypothetical protein